MFLFLCPWPRDVKRGQGPGHWWLWLRLGTRDKTEAKDNFIRPRLRPIAAVTERSCTLSHYILIHKLYILYQQDKLLSHTDCKPQASNEIVTLLAYWRTFPPFQLPFSEQTKHQNAVLCVTNIRNLAQDVRLRWLENAHSQPLFSMGNFDPHSRLDWPIFLCAIKFLRFQGFVYEVTVCNMYNVSHLCDPYLDYFWPLWHKEVYQAWGECVCVPMSGPPIVQTKCTDIFLRWRKCLIE